MLERRCFTMVDTPAQHPHHAMDRLMKLTRPARLFLGPADHGDCDTPVVHKHDELENAGEEDVASFDIERDSHGHNYGVDKADRG